MQTLRIVETSRRSPTLDDFSWLPPRADDPAVHLLFRYPEPGVARAL